MTNRSREWGIVPNNLDKKKPAELNVHYNSFKVSMLQVLSKQEYYDLIMLLGNQPNNRYKTLTPNYMRDSSI